MKYQTWEPGLSGLIYLPHPRSVAGDKKRTFYILTVDKDGRCELREGPMSWTKANERIHEIALEKSLIAFSAPLDENIAKHRSQNRLVFDP